MGKRGPRPRPAHIQIVEGAREGRINRDEPTPEDSEVSCPADVDDDVRAIWDRLAPDLVAKKVLTSWDVDSFLILCQSIALREECWRKMRDLGDEWHGGLIKQGSAGGLIPNPLFRIINACNQDIAKFGSRFGLTPGDRAQLKIDADEGPSAGAERLLS
jgi:P27 family predicted phage terminase small subunit